MEFMVIEVLALPDIGTDNECCFSDLRVGYLRKLVADSLRMRFQLTHESSFSALRLGGAHHATVQLK